MGEILNLFQEVPANIRLNGMAHYYSFDKVSGTTLYDMIANGQNGTISGAISATGVTGNCLYFDGASNVDLSGITFNSNIFSLSFWIHSASISTTTKIIFDTYPTRFNLAWTYNSSGAKISLYLGGSWVAFDAVPDDDQWHHICLNINNTNAILYLDSVQYGATKTIGGFDLSGITTVKLGSDYNNANYFEGFIDDFKIYNRNLTYDEIYKLYNVNAPTISDVLTGIKVTYTYQDGADKYLAIGGGMKAGFEDETDADGGVNLKTLETSATLTDLSSLSLDWQDRYNYRIGGCNIYKITEIKLYRNGVIGETQSGNFIVGGSIGNFKEGIFGYNINPSSRNNTSAPTASGYGYPKDMLSGIKVTYVQEAGKYSTLGTARAGFENETDADGGTNLANLTSGSVIDLTALNISWDDRYNYRIGGANIYRITEIILYRNGSIAESQTSLTINSDIVVGREGHCGFNINPSSRNRTQSSTAAGVGYPKLIT